MLTLPEAVPIFVAVDAIDLRRSFDGLVRATREVLRHDPQRGGLFLFFNRANTHCKPLFWDRTGFALLYKRLERGTFRLPRAADAGSTQLRISARELAALLEGVVDTTSLEKERS